LRFLIASIWLRCFRRELLLEVSALACELADCGGRLDGFGLEGDDPIGIASGRGPLIGWISIGVEVGIFCTLLPPIRATLSVTGIAQSGTVMVRYAPFSANKAS
jgi:hypothetical protein